MCCTNDIGLSYTLLQSTVSQLSRGAVFLFLVILLNGRGMPMFYHMKKSLVSLLLIILVNECADYAAKNCLQLKD